MFVFLPAMNIEHNRILADDLCAVHVVIHMPTAGHKNSPLAYIVYYSMPVA